MKTYVTVTFEVDSVLLDSDANASTTTVFMLKCIARLRRKFNWGIMTGNKVNISNVKIETKPQN